MENPWWIAVTASSMEKRAASALAERGFEVWFPTRLVKFQSRHMKRPAERAYPQFPSYLFVRSTGFRAAFRFERIDGYLCRVNLGAQPHMHDWREMIGVEGIKGILSNDFRASLFSDERVSKLRAHLDDVALKAIDAAIWRQDDLARISSGPLVGFSAKVVRGERRGSVSVLMTLFGRSSVVEMPIGHLEKVA